MSDKLFQIPKLKFQVMSITVSLIEIELLKSLIESSEFSSFKKKKFICEGPPILNLNESHLVHR